MNEFILLILEKVFEAIYFSLFLIWGKNIKNKRLLFIGIMIFQYLVLTSFIEFNVMFQIIYTFLSFINLKFLYKEKAQITDIFLFMFASVVLMILSAIAYFSIYFTIKKYIVALILSRILICLFILLFKNKINLIYKKFYSLWNKHNKENKIKSLTMRNISVIIFNLMFYFINVGLTFIIFSGKVR
jgi:hypothetical protein